MPQMIRAMRIDENTLHLAGFTLAHAAWSVSDLPEGELLCPLAMVEEGGERKLLRFEAESQEQAIGNALAALEVEKSKASTWAFVREGTINTSQGKTDVLLLVVWAKGMNEPLYLSQSFEPYAKRGVFKIVGPLEIVKGEDTEESAQTITELVREGIFKHPKVAPLWPQWETTHAA
jgi:hypothetical protein